MSTVSNIAQKFTSAASNMQIKPSGRIALVGAGWWSQGWHLPTLHNNPKANIAAIVNRSPDPGSNLDPDMVDLEELGKKYNARTFHGNDGYQKMLEEMGDELDGVLIATPHWTHFDIGTAFLDENKRRTKNGMKPLHIMMEKPMETTVDNAIKLRERAMEKEQGESRFFVNHSANWRDQAKMAREAITSGRIGRVRHITAFFAAPLKAVFEDEDNGTWTDVADGMVGNGFGWGQSSHLFAWLFHVCPQLVPDSTYCDMTHSTESGADVSFSASIRCKEENELNSDNAMEDVVISASGTTLLPDEGDGRKRIMVEIYGTEGCLTYSGIDQDPSSGKLELRDNDGNVHVLHDKFHFENLDNEGIGPESLQAFVAACNGDYDNAYEGATADTGLRAVLVIESMYRSNESKKPESVRKAVTPAEMTV